MINYHTHTTFSDGKDTMEAMVLAAIERGITTLGISDHQFAAYDPDYCMKPDAFPAYIAEFERLRNKYADRVTLKLGLELDALAGDFDVSALDFTIGSVHYIQDANGRKYNIDGPEAVEALNVYCGGDSRLYCEHYFETLCAFVERVKPTIIGHADILKKENIDNCLFDEQSAWYVELSREAAARLAATGCKVEINYGGMLKRKYLKEPYPSRAMLDVFKQHGTEFVVSSDSHSVLTIDFGLREGLALIESLS
jgi:histidinol-phosphatase (PHP family)